MNLSRRDASLLLVVCGIALVGCSRDPEVRKQKYFASAIQLLNQAKSAKAVLNLRNALQIDPGFVEAANVLAELQARTGNYHEAFTLLEQAEKTRPDYLPARKGLAKLYQLAGKSAQALEEVDYILGRTPDDTDVLFILGNIQAGQKKSTEAEGTFNRILEIQPGHVPALLALASIQEKSRNALEAERYLKLAVERNPRSAVVYLSLLKFYLGHGRPSDAQVLFPQALKMTGNNILILEAQEGFYEGSGKPAIAEEVARNIQTLHANDPNFWTALADFYVRINDWTKAKAELEHVLSQHKDDDAAIHKLIEVHLNLNDPTSARKLNDALLRRNPRDGYAHLFEGRLHLNAGNADKALSEFNKTQQFHPDYPALYYWYAQAYLQKREFQRARDSLGTALKYNPDYQAARLQLADLDNQAGAPDAAMYEAQRAIKANPADTRAMLLYSQSLLQKHDYTVAAKVISTVVARDPNSADVHRQLGILELVKKDSAGAQKEFKQAWDLDPQSKPLLEAIILGYLGEKQTAAANDFLQGEIRHRPQDPMLYHELAQLYLLSGKQNEAISALQNALSLAPNNLGSTLLLAETYASMKQPEQALETISVVMQKHAQDSSAMLRAGILFEKLEHWSEAQTAYEKAVQLDSSNAIAKNNLAWLLVSRGGNIDTALGLAQQAKEQLVDNVQVTATLAWIYYQKHIYKTALSYLQQCVAQDQKNATFQYELGMTYWKLGDKTQARHSLLTALALDLRSPDAATARAALANF